MAKKSANVRAIVYGSGKSTKSCEVIECTLNEFIQNFQEATAGADPCPEEIMIFLKQINTFKVGPIGLAFTVDHKEAEFYSTLHEALNRALDFLE